MPSTSYVDEPKARQPVAQQPLQKQHWTPYLFFCTISIIMGSSFMFGYNAGVINAPFAVMNAYVNESFARTNHTLSKTELSDMWSLVVVLHLIGGVTGSIWFAGALAGRLGRKNALIVTAIMGAVGASCSFITPWTKSHIPLMIGRPIVGFSNGMAMVYAPGLINEQAPARIRGALGSLFVLGSPVGYTTTTLIGLGYILGRSNTWHYLFLIVAVLYGVQAVCLLFVVESPRSLILQNKEDEAVTALMKLRSASMEEVLPEVQKLKEAINSEPVVQAVSVSAVFKDRTLWWPIFLVVNIQISCQLTGLGAAYYYATKVMKDAGMHGNDAALANFGISWGTILGNVLNLIFVDRLGGRLIMIVTLALVVAANIMLVIVIKFHVLEACIAGFLIFLTVYLMGPGPIPFFMSAELTMPAAKPVALAIGMAVNWSGKIITGFIFPVMQRTIGPYSFLPFACVAFVELIITILFLPETSAALVDYSPNQFAPGKPLLQLKRRWPYGQKSERDRPVENGTNFMH